MSVPHCVTIPSSLKSLPMIRRDIYTLRSFNHSSRIRYRHRDHNRLSGMILPRNLLEMLADEDLSGSLRTGLVAQYG